MMRILVLAFMVLVLLSGCNSSGQTTVVPQPGNKADLAFINARVYTLDSNFPWAEALLVKNNQILFVGDKTAAETHIGASTRIIDLQGKMLMPGIHDTHLHPLEAGSARVSCHLDSEQTLSQMLSIIEGCVQDSAGQDWLLGWGHALETLLNGQQTPRALLDQIANDRPIAIMEATSHSVWVNSKALERAGITDSTPHPVGGAILKDSQGKPNGVLLDSAGDQVFELANAPTDANMRDNYIGLQYGLEQVAKNGITSIVDARIYWQRGYLETWQRMAREGKLTARAQLSLWAYPSLDDNDQLERLKSMYHSDPSSLLQVNKIKLYSDGIIHNTTAALHAPYTQSFPEVGDRGLNYFTKERLTRYVTELERVGFDMHIHAIGDRGVTESLDAIEAAKGVNNLQQRRHRLTHIELVSEQDKPRFAQLGVIADFQLAGDFTKPENHHWSEALVGERAHKMLPVKDILDTGAVVTLSSDWDVSSLSPFIGMQNALTRGAQSFPDRHSVIKAYTLNGAYSMQQEQYTGSLEVGKWADLIVVDRNLLTADVNTIGATRVLLTMVNGKIVYNQL
ncbi:amidohydrolase [Pleionea sp. CnH1-48]|uniref:amidohydrolase n=1 Tax=Pleionea sp. CnH1-48 TaxID=2954494 RepID=UPI0020971D25|nr:amidohydrolase [Pleionea sp. CnH1-48]MCO7224257.1 amidohydrolase [Pleionea sp. CnH1-48]